MKTYVLWGYEAKAQSSESLQSTREDRWTYISITEDQMRKVSQERWCKSAEVAYKKD